MCDQHKKSAAAGSAKRARPRQDNGLSVDLATPHGSIALNELPVELLHAILLQAAVAGVRDVTCDVCDDDFIETALTSLADVCRKWRAIVSDDAGYFRRNFWQKLLRVEPALLYRSATQFQQLHLPGFSDVIKGVERMRIALLGNELFGLPWWRKDNKTVIHVWTLGALSSQYPAGLAREESYRSMPMDAGLTDLCILRLETCELNSCLYVNLVSGNVREFYIARLRATDGRVAAKWSVPRNQGMFHCSSVVASSGQVVIADTAASRLLVYDADGRQLRSIAVARAGKSLVIALPASRRPAAASEAVSYVTGHVPDSPGYMDLKMLRLSRIEVDNPSDPDAKVVATGEGVEAGLPNCVDDLGHLLQFAWTSDDDVIRMRVVNDADVRLRRSIDVPMLPARVPLSSVAFCVDARRGRLYAVLGGRRVGYTESRAKLRLVYADLWRYRDHSA